MKGHYSMERASVEDVAREGGSRQQFLKKAGLAGGAAFLAMAATSTNPFADGIAFAHAQVAGLTDLDILNFALGLEHLEAAFYAKVITSGKFSGKNLKILSAIHDHEVAHVAALTGFVKAFGGTPVTPMATYHFGDFSSAAAILATAETLEITGVGAYTGAAGLVSAANRAKVIPAAGSIEQVEARHYAAILLLQDKNPSPMAFGPINTVAQVQAAIKPIVSM